MLRWGRKEGIRMTEPQPDTDELPDDLVVEENVPDPEGDKPE